MHDPFIKNALGLCFQFRKMLNKELTHFAESSKSGSQVSQFLINTYMDKDDDELSQNLRVCLIV